LNKKYKLLIGERTAERVKIHGATHTMDWKVWKLSAIDVKGRMLERVSRAIVLSEDTAITQNWLLQLTLLVLFRLGIMQQRAYSNL